MCTAIYSFPVFQRLSGGTTGLHSCPDRSSTLLQTDYKSSRLGRKKQSGLFRYRYIFCIESAGREIRAGELNVINVQ